MERPKEHEKLHMPSSHIQRALEGLTLHGAVHALDFV